LSRLDTVIHRLKAQRACLALAFELIAELPGPVVELGLGNGRTYDHLRERLPDREIFVFERRPAPHPGCLPPAPYLVAGDFAATLPSAPERIGSPAALLHSDIGTGDEERNARLAGWIAHLLPPMLAEGAVVASDQALSTPCLQPLRLPDAVPEGRYFMYRRVGLVDD
jgi:hypothetical protein